MNLSFFTQPFSPLLLLSLFSLLPLLLLLLLLLLLSPFPSPVVCKSARAASVDEDDDHGDNNERTTTLRSPERNGAFCRNVKALNVGLGWAFSRSRGVLTGMESDTDRLRAEVDVDAERSDGGWKGGAVGRLNFGVHVMIRLSIRCYTYLTWF